MGGIRVDILGGLASSLGLLNLRSALRELRRVGAETLQEVRERRRSEEHAGQVRQTLVLIDERPVVSTEVAVLSNLVCNLGFKLGNVF